MKSLGICCGASTITLVVLERQAGHTRMLKVISRPHDGNPKQVVEDTLRATEAASFERVASTGRKLKDLLNLTSISEPRAVEESIRFIRHRYPDLDAVVSAGGETFMVYQLDRHGCISKVHTGNKCASGTGEFFLQQIRRMNVELDDAVEYARTECPYQVSGRCSVFCKSDCTHATNKGIPKGQVVAGLCRMMAGKVLELLKNIPNENVLVVGGTTRNDIMIEYLKAELPGLSVPEEAGCFEALGAALWACENYTDPVDPDQLFKEEQSQFEYHAPLAAYEQHVTFASGERGTVRNGDVCILGLDVGSTTTKAVLVRQSDQSILASEYLRTNGDPVAASRACYRSLKRQLRGRHIAIEGLGVTGSGRNIAGLHALTDGVINEIIAHAAAAIHFDPDVDTIFEIGGQDAKYTYITNGVASDYAMNEACSAGTGSFLEESAKESLGIEMEEIARWAMKGTRPPNFNDQCAAFISSDIKNAAHEGLSKEDTVAGLVYSICMNYVNRVKGARPVGRKVFMQGGVCYNRAVPVAMAALCGKEIVVPPEPGLMGAYGVALEVQDRIEKGTMSRGDFSLETLVDREVDYKEPFICKGGKENCDIGCEISRISIEDRIYPFGGACNRYYNLLHKIDVDAGEYDLVALREKMVFEDFAADFTDLPGTAPTIGLNRSFLINTLYPFFSHFFKEIGFRVVLPDHINPEGVEARSAPFCFPFEISHGYFHNLIEKKPDRIFLPHIQGLEVENGYYPSKVCPLVQGEPFVLYSTFEHELSGIPVHKPFLQFNSGRDAVKAQLVQFAGRLGIRAGIVNQAVDHAWGIQKQLEAAMRNIGRQTIEWIEQSPDRFGMVLFGRPYNAFVHEANKGIPHKFASRGIKIIPMDFLDLREIEAQDHMYWSMGQIILKGADVLRQHPQLFGTYITNFSCGPDSFIVGFFRDKMGRKPSLTLELDNHTADAGLETRIEAFLDIVHRYRGLEDEGAAHVALCHAVSRIESDRFIITTSSGEEVGLRDPRVKLVFPSMSPWLTRGFSAACCKVGVRAEALPAMTEEDLKRGKGNTLCKECLPMQLTTGALLNYLDQREKGEITVYFMPTTEGPCRFGQYQVYMKNLIRKKGIRDVVFMSLSSDDNYAGLGSEFVLLGWYSSVIGGCFNEIHNLMLVNAVDRDAAIAQLNRVYENVLAGMQTGGWSGLRVALKQSAAALSGIPMKIPVEKLPTVMLVGEIYVRSEPLARRWLPELLAEQGLATYVTPVHEWVYYTSHQFNNKANDLDTNWADRMGNRLRSRFLAHVEKDVNRILAGSGWHVPRHINMKRLMKTGDRYLSDKLFGEGILTIGGPMVEVGHEFCGAIAIGPFGCMPNRLSEAILSRSLDREHISQIRRDRKTDRVLSQMETMPFLSIESDGSPFPQIINARLEAFIIQAKRLNRIMNEKRPVVA